MLQRHAIRLALVAVSAFALACADEVDGNNTADDDPAVSAPSPDEAQRPTGEEDHLGDGEPTAPDPTRQSATAPTPGPPSALPPPSLDRGPPVDLPGSADDRLWLGMDVADARPRLTAGCVSDHYAERLAPYYLRLSCQTELRGRPADERRIRFGVLEGDWETAQPTRLAYHIEELELPADQLGEAFERLRADAETRLGSPTHSDGPAAPGPGTRLSWRGTGRDDRSTTFELRVQAGSSGRVVVSSAYREVELSNALFDQR